MRTLILALACLMPATVIAQQGMTPQQQQQMQQMMMQNMQNLEKVSNCFAQVDQHAFKDLEVRAKAMEAEVKKLCAAGQRDAAEAKAIAFGKEINANPELQKMRQCGAMYNKMPLPGQFFPKDEKDTNRKHICA